MSGALFAQKASESVRWRTFLPLATGYATWHWRLIAGVQTVRAARITLQPISQGVACSLR